MCASVCVFANETFYSGWHSVSFIFDAIVYTTNWFVFFFFVAVPRSCLPLCLTMFVCLTKAELPTTILNAYGTRIKYSCISTIVTNVQWNGPHTHTHTLNIYL